jgi:hypothetical protein
MDTDGFQVNALVDRFWKISCRRWQQEGGRHGFSFIISPKKKKGMGRVAEVEE